MTFCEAFFTLEMDIHISPLKPLEETRHIHNQYKIPWSINVKRFLKLADRIYSQETLLRPHHS